MILVHEVTEKTDCFLLKFTAVNGKWPDSYKVLFYSPEALYITSLIHPFMQAFFSLFCSSAFYLTIKRIRIRRATGV